MPPSHQTRNKQGDTDISMSFDAVTVQESCHGLKHD
jgi:hypothetical protein